MFPRAAPWAITARPFGASERKTRIGGTPRPPGHRGGRDRPMTRPPGSRTLGPLQWPLCEGADRAGDRDGTEDGTESVESMSRLTVLCFAGTYSLALLCDLARFVVRGPARWYAT